VSPRIPFFSGWLHRRRSRELFWPFVRPGDLVFDVGAHRGATVETFLELGARVVAVEPGAGSVARLRARWNGSPRVRVIAAAAGARVGRAVLHRSSADQVATLSPAFREAYPGGEGLAWLEAEEVPVVTLAALAEEHGNPAFCKVDAEGWDDEVLAGLGRLPRALCFEALDRLPQVAEACVRRLAARGSSLYNLRCCDQPRFELSSWVDAGELLRTLGPVLSRVRHVDVFARFEG
jgi:FkbM family methyltransferase